MIWNWRNIPFEIIDFTLSWVDFQGFNKYILDLSNLKVPRNSIKRQYTVIYVIAEVFLYCDSVFIIIIIILF